MTIANTTIVVKKSGVSGNVPSTLANGELAINYADGKLYYKTATGTIAAISGAGANSFATINASGTLVLASSNNDILTILGSNGITVSACSTSKTVTVDDGITFNVANSKTQTYYQNNAPSSPNANDLWVANTGVMYENFGNTTYPVWAEVGPTGTISNTSPGIIYATSIYDNGIELLVYANSIYAATNSAAAFANAAFIQANNTSSYANAQISILTGIEVTQNTNITSAQSYANSAFTKANNALANTSGVVTAGDFVISGNTTVKQLISTYNGTNGGAALVVSGTGTQGGAGYFDFIRANNTTNGTSAMSFRLDNTGSVQLVNSAYTTTVWAITQTGVMFVGTGSASSSNNDATTNYINFNSQNSVIYDDGNFHIHSRGSGQAMWINTNGGDLRLLSQTTVNGGSQGTSVIMGGVQSNTASGFLNVLSSKNMTYSGYGYLSSSGAGTISGSSGSVPVAIYTPYRIYSGEVDSTSDERLKDIKGTIPTDIAIKFIKDVNGIHYTWKQGYGDDGLKSGFGAQTVHKAGFAHMVSGIPNESVEGKVDDDGWAHPDKEQLNISYNEAIPYHHEVIKYLLDKIEKLEQTVAELKGDN